MSSSIVLTSRNVILPGQHTPSPATIVVDKATGKIAAVSAGYGSRVEYAPDVHWVDARTNYILPGLVE